MADGTSGEFFVLRYRKVNTDIWLRHHEMASNLPYDLPSRLMERLHRFFAGNIAKFDHLNQTATTIGFESPTAHLDMDF